MSLMIYGEGVSLRQLNEHNEMVLDLPVGTEIVGVRQGELPPYEVELVCLGDPERWRPRESRRFCAVLTNVPLDEAKCYRYIGRVPVAPEGVRARWYYLLEVLPPGERPPWEEEITEALNDHERHYSHQVDYGPED